MTHVNPLHKLGDDKFLRAFEAGEIALRDWDHRGHVRYAWITLEVEPRFDRAMDRVRAGLKAHLDTAIAAGETPEFGYHETITRFWMSIVARARDGEGAHEDSCAFCAAHPELLDKALLGRHYSKALLLDPRSRRLYVEPDLAPLGV
ncbi:MAG: hypothetical protein H6813_02965 [Phycisphaeraceae bacterium]|nr:hypothetical protein [Phycisphaeraceae bacterium]MCB9848722.1 hypothetical protein [Phycisphaeraceae bacterium]